MAVWKQPIPTNLDEIFGKDYFAKFTYIELLLRAKNGGEESSTEFAGTLHFLKRGQCVCGEAEVGAFFEMGRHFGRNVIDRLQKRYKKVDISKTSKGTVVTIKNYSDVVKMDNSWNNNGTTTVQQRDTNKSVENERVEEGKPAKKSSLDVGNQEELKKACQAILKGKPDGFDAGLWLESVDETACKAVATFMTGEVWTRPAIFSYATKVYRGKAKKQNAN